MSYIVDIKRVPHPDQANRWIKVKCEEVTVDEGVLALKISGTLGRFFPLSQIREFKAEQVE